MHDRALAAMRPLVRCCASSLLAACLLMTAGCGVRWPAPAFLAAWSPMAAPATASGVSGPERFDVVPMAPMAPTAVASGIRVPAPRPLRAGGAGDLGLRLLWPVRGEIVGAFGKQPNGGRNDGFDIRATGTTVLAAAAGTVVYAARDVPGFGTLVMIHHQDAFTTVYARARGLLIGAGDHVVAGQAIAGLVGGTGDAPRLHFQLRSASTPVDPVPFLVPDERVMASVAPPPR